MNAIKDSAKEIKHNDTAPSQKGGSADPTTLKTDSMETNTENTAAPSVDVPRLVRPLSKEGVADCPQCHSPQSVARHNADWTCHRCGYCETVDDDREAERAASKQVSVDLTLPGTWQPRKGSNW
jgi:ribosomal protein S27AE